MKKLNKILNQFSKVQTQLTTLIEANKDKVISNQTKINNLSDTNGQLRQESLKANKVLDNITKFIGD